MIVLLTRSLRLALVSVAATSVACVAGSMDDPSTNVPDDGGASDDVPPTPIDAPPVDAPNATDAATSHDDTTSPDARVDPGSDAAPLANPWCTAGAPLVGAAGAWSYLPVSGAECANGTPVGLGINPSPTKSARLLIFLQGGGLCWDATSCQPPSMGGKAANVDGFDATKLATELKWFGPGSITDRTSSTNPFRDWNYVFVPYCTGDFHTGDRVAEYGVHHVGYRNLTRFLERIVPTWCAPEQVVLTGVSAGGFGATFNYVHVKEAFGPSVPIDLVDDSGPYMRPPYMKSTQQDQLRATWGTLANTPKDCAACTTAWHELYPYLSTKYPSARISLVSSVADQVIGPAFQIYDPYTMMRATGDLADAVLSPLPNVRYFYIEGNQHVWEGQNLASIATKSTTLAAFLQAQISGGGAGWSSVRP